MMVVLAGCSAAELLDPGSLPETAPAPRAEDRRHDLDYAPDSPAQRLDLSVPAGTRPAPVVVYVHGGDWRGGDKSEVQRNGRPELLKAGYAVASINYRLAADAPWPAAVRDTKAAIRWLRANARLYNLDPSRIAVLGDSSGGYMAAAAGLTGDQSTVFDEPRLGNPRTSSAVQATVLWSAPVDFASLDRQIKAAGCGIGSHAGRDSAESRWLGTPVGEGGAKVRRSNLLDHVVTRPAPFLFVHGTADCAVPPAQSRGLSEAIRQAGGRTELTLIKGMNQVAGKHAGDRIRRTIDFLSGALGPVTP